MPARPPDRHRAEEDADASRLVDLPVQTRADVRLMPESVDAERRTVEVVWSTGAAVRRRDPWTGKRYDEVLSLYASNADREAQVRTPITDGAHDRPWVFRYKDIRSWWSNPHRNRPGGVESGSTTAWVPESKPIRFTEIGCPAVDRGPNQPSVFYDPKSAESFLPYFSRGWRDDAVQRRFLEAALGYWAEPSNNPMSAVYGGRMIVTAETAAWTWDARPYPAFPARSDVWTDADNWRLGHWLNGRLGSVSLGSLVRELCRRAGLPDSGAVFEQEATADLPAANQFLAPRLFMNNGATPAAVAFDCSGVYVETDF